MGDLARSIVDMAEAARDRSAALKDLREATDMVAAALAEKLRVGDSVTIRGGTTSSQVVFGIVRYQVMQVTWPVTAASGSDLPHDRGTKALVREDAVLASPEGIQLPMKSVPGLGGPWNPTSTTRVGRLRDVTDKSHYDLHYASGDERAVFAAEAQRVVDAFRGLLQAEARTFGFAAGKVAKVVID